MRSILTFLVLALAAVCSFGQNLVYGGNVSIGGNNGGYHSSGGGGSPFAVNYWGPTNSTTGSIAYTLTNSVGTGNKLVLLYAASGTGQTISGVADDAGNSWTVDYSSADNYYIVIASATITSALSSGQHITVTYGASALMEKIACAIAIPSATTFDVTGSQAYGFRQPVSAPATAASGSQQVGIIMENNTSSTYTPAGTGWAIIGVHYTLPSNGDGIDYFYHTGATGSIDPAGQVSAAIGNKTGWNSYK